MSVGEGAALLTQITGVGLHWMLMAGDSIKCKRW